MQCFLGFLPEMATNDGQLVKDKVSLTILCTLVVSGLSLAVGLYTNYQRVVFAAALGPWLMAITGIMYFVKPFRPSIGIPRAILVRFVGAESGHDPGWDGMFESRVRGFCIHSRRQA
jgi:hypothetical protein